MYIKREVKPILFFLFKTPSSVLRDQTNKSLENQAAFVRSSSDSSDDGDVFATPIRPKWIDKRKDKGIYYRLFSTQLYLFLY